MAPYCGPIIDAHHHLWDYGAGHHAWVDTEESGLPMGDLTPLRRDYLVADYLADMAGQDVVASVHVEAGWQGGPEGAETAFLDTLDRRVVAARHVFHADLGASDADRRVAAEAAHPRAAGVRDVVAWHPDPGRSFAPRAGRMSDPDWRHGLGAVAARGLVFELMLYPAQMDEARDLAAAFPDLVIVLNHCGSPADRSERGMAEWAAALSRLAEAPNLRVKISDPVAYDHDWTEDSLRPVFAHCLEAFGPERAMFGSDFPVAGLHAEPAALMAAYRTLTAELDPAAQRAFFHDTAARTYGLDLRAGA